MATTKKTKEKEAVLQPVVDAPQPEIQLSDEEKESIKTARAVEIKKEVFIQAYNKLVEQHGFAITVDLGSPISKPLLTVVQLG